MTDLDDAINYYRSKLRKTGIALTLSQLVQHLKKAHITVKKDELAH